MFRSTYWLHWRAEDIILGILVEPAIDGMSEKNRQLYNYDIFSARTANIYTPTLLEQWTDWALGEGKPPKKYGKAMGRYIDPFEPKIVQKDSNLQVNL